MCKSHVRVKAVMMTKIRNKIHRKVLAKYSVNNFFIFVPFFLVYMFTHTYLDMNKLENRHHFSSTCPSTLTTSTLTFFEGKYMQTKVK